LSSIDAAPRREGVQQRAKTKREERDCSGSVWVTVRCGSRSPTLSGSFERKCTTSAQNLRRLFDANGNLKAIKDLSDDEAAALVSMDIVREHANADDDHLETVIRVRVHDKIRALEMLAKHFVLLKEHIEHAHTFLVLDEDRIRRLSDEQLAKLAEASAIAPSLVPMLSARSVCVRSTARTPYRRPCA
jgi:hypothetical protein